MPITRHADNPTATRKRRDRTLAAIYNSRTWREHTRPHIINRDNHKCVVCGKPAQPGDPLTVAHTYPTRLLIAAGHNPHNPHHLQTKHRTCHAQTTRETNRPLPGTPTIHTTLDHLPDRRALIIMCGPVGAGKSTLAHEHWPNARIDVSAHRLNYGPLSDQTTMRQGFIDAYNDARARLSRGELAVFDSTAVTPNVRAMLQRIALEHHVAAHVVLVDTPTHVAAQRNTGRSFPVPTHAVERNHRAYTTARTEVMRERWQTITVIANGLKQPFPSKGGVVMGATEAPPYSRSAHATEDRIEGRP